MNTNDKKLCMIIGDPVAHSLSPAIHNAGYKALGIDDKYKFIAQRVAPKDLEDFMLRLREENIAGVSCTSPHKEAVIPYLDEVGDTARSIGAVNTIINKNGVLYGENTDWIGAIEPLVKMCDLKRSTAAVIGAGGAGKAFVYGLVNAGCKVTIYNRTLERAKELAIQFGCEFKPLSDQIDIKNIDIVCNTTSVGMDSNETPVDQSNLNSSQVVFDAIYSPLKTRLIKEAKEKGAKTIYGTEMLLSQGFAQFKMFTGQDAPDEAMRKALMEELSEK